MRKTIYFPRSLGSDSSKGEGGGGGREKNNSNSNYDTEIIEPPEYPDDEQRKKRDQQENKQSRNDLLKRFFPDILKAIGNKAIKESPPTLQELEAYLQQY